MSKSGVPRLAGPGLGTPPRDPEPSPKDTINGVLTGLQSWSPVFRRNRTQELWTGAEDLTRPVPEARQILVWRFSSDYILVRIKFGLACPRIVMSLKGLGAQS